MPRISARRALPRPAVAPQPPAPGNQRRVVVVPRSKTSFSQPPRRALCLVAFWRKCDKNCRVSLKRLDSVARRARRESGQQELQICGEAPRAVPAAAAVEEFAAARAQERQEVLRVDHWRKFATLLWIGKNPGIRPFSTDSHPRERRHYSLLIATRSHGSVNEPATGLARGAGELDSPVTQFRGYRRPGTMADPVCERVIAFWSDVVRGGDRRGSDKARTRPRRFRLQRPAATPGTARV